jgi:hypothetical protein
MMNTRFLLACDTLPTNPWERDRLPAIRKATRGWDFQIIDIYEFNSREEAHQIHKQRGGSFFKNNSLKELNRKFYERILSYRCDVLILGTVDNYAQFLLPETVTKLQENGVYVVGILGDDEFTYERNRLYVPMFDKVVAYVQEYVNLYNSFKSNSCYYLPNSCYFREHYFSRLQVSEHEKQHDVMLAGAPFGIRPQLIEALIDSGVKISLFGSPAWQDYKKLKDYYRGYISSDGFDRVIQRSKIVLAPLEDHLTGASHMNTKIWEAVRNGQMCITTRYKPLVENYGFDENESIVMYDSVDDLVNKVRFYLKNSDERTRIAKNTFEEVKKHFDYVDLYKELFCKIEQDYLVSQQTPIPVKTSSPLVTIIDHSSSGESHWGFECVRLPRANDWKCLRQNYQSWIQTPYVILTYGRFSYSRYLNRLLDTFPNLIVDGGVRLLPLLPLPQETDAWIIDINSVVWEKDAFYNQYLSKRIISRYFYWRHISYVSKNLRLCRTTVQRKKDRRLTLLLWLYRSMKNILRVIIKKYFPHSKFDKK